MFSMTTSGDILKLVFIIPERIKQLDVLRGKWSLHAVDHVVVVSTLTSRYLRL